MFVQSISGIEALMKVLLFASGSRGDIQPVMALGKALDNSGHEATLITPASSNIMAQGLKVATLKNKYWNNPPIDLDYYHKLQHKRSALRRGVKILRNGKVCDIEALRELSTVSNTEADLVVHELSHPGRHIAEWLGVPSVAVSLQPYWIPTKLFPQPDLPIPVPRWLNRFSYKWASWNLRAIEHARYSENELARWRRDILKLAQRRGYQNPLRSPNRGSTTLLHAFSRHVLPAPLDYPDSVHTTGYWFLPTPENWQPTQALNDFISDGSPPICVALGTLGGPNPHRTTRVVVEALRKARVRAVVITSSSGIVPGELSDDVYTIEEVPFGWLFPRMAAIVHAGGAGTTAQALAAGCPQVVCPIDADQPFWAKRMYSIGVAPAPQPEQQLASENLAHAIRRALRDKAIAQQARKIGKRVRREDGVMTAVKLLESIVRS